MLAASAICPSYKLHAPTNEKPQIPEDCSQIAATKQSFDLSLFLMAANTIGSMHLLTARDHPQYINNGEDACLKENQK